MVQSAVIRNESSGIFPNFNFQETVAAGRSGHHIKEDKKELERQKRLLEREKRQLVISQEQAEKRMGQRERLFEMKWKLLQEELIKLASEKEEFQYKKEYYEKLEKEAQEGQTVYEVSTKVTGSGFFSGVEGAASLKRRYKDLIKIYHPDNLAGDKGMLQRINQEYDELKRQLT